MEISLSYFSIAREGITLNQLRFHNEQEIITDRQLEKLNVDLYCRNTTQIDMATLQSL